MGKNRSFTPIAVYRWNQYLSEWIPFTGSVNEKGQVQVEVVESIPIDSAKNNPSYVVSLNASNEPVRIDETIDGVTYRTTIVPPSADVTITQTKTISSAVQI